MSGGTPGTPVPSAICRVGGLPERMNMNLVEPLRELFKDEVRALAAIKAVNSALRVE
jgi:GMP synthase PP-ATPase subunit